MSGTGVERRGAWHEPLHDDAGLDAVDPPGGGGNERSGGPEPAKLILREPQAEIQQMVAGWRFDYVTTKAEALGLRRDTEFGDNMTAARVSPCI